MANNNEDLFKRTTIDAESKKKLEELEKSFPDMDRQLSALKKMGINTRELEEKMQWAKDVTKIIKEDFV